MSSLHSVASNQACDITNEEAPNEGLIAIKVQFPELLVKDHMVGSSSQAK